MVLQEGSARFINPAGIRVQLPFSLTVPFAREVALHTGPQVAPGFFFRRYAADGTLRTG
jgi:hypothetical protein